MRKQILIIHGAGVQVLHRRNTDWQATLQDALGAKYEVLTPQMQALKRRDMQRGKVDLKKVSLS